MQRLGLIGFGQFGRLAAGVLREHFELIVTDAAPAARVAAEELGVAFGTLPEAAACEVVVVAAPVAAMREVFAAMAPYMKPGALVADVGSVKMLPARWMSEILPAHADLVATHPLFGPQSARNGVAGLRLVVCPVRGGRRLGLTVTITTPEEHDREMAYVQALTHLIGRSLSRMGIPDEQLKTQSYQHLLDLCGLIGADTFELFTAIQTQNPFAAEVATAFVDQARDLLRKVGVGN